MTEHNFTVRDRRNKGWFYLDNEYLNGYAKIFGPIGTGIYLSLCRHASLDQKCFPSEAKIAEEISIGERTVRKYLRMLEKWNVIFVEKTRSSGGKFLHNTYFLIDKSEWKKPPARHADGTKGASPSANENTNQRHVVPDKNTHEKKTYKKDTHASVRSAEDYKKELNISLEKFDCILSQFEAVNPAAYRLFKVRAQRDALWRLVEKLGVEKIEEVILVLPSIIQKPYAPRITDPISLERKLGELFVFVKQEESKNNRVGIII